MPMAARIGRGAVKSAVLLRRTARAGAHTCDAENSARRVISMILLCDAKRPVSDTLIL